MAYCPECEQLVRCIAAPRILLPDGRYRPRVEIVPHEGAGIEGLPPTECDGSGMRI